MQRKRAHAINRKIFKNSVFCVSDVAIWGENAVQNGFAPSRRLPDTPGRIGSGIDSSHCAASTNRTRVQTVEWVGNLQSWEIERRVAMPQSSVVVHPVANVGNIVLIDGSIHNEEGTPSFAILNSSDNDINSFSGREAIWMIIRSLCGPR
jgi:hypothetical protein